MDRLNSSPVSSPGDISTISESSSRFQVDPAVQKGNLRVSKFTLLDKRFRSEQLLEELLQVLIYGNTSTEMNYTFYVEVIHLLIVLFSGQMMQSPGAKEDTLFIKIMLDSLRYNYC